jgi:hypothetical protein
MKFQVTLTRTDTGANTKIKSESSEWSKDYASFDDALDEAKRVGLINSVESVAAKALPPGFPLHTNAELEFATFSNQGFVIGKTPPAQ